MSLAADFQRILDALPPDWTDLEVDLRIDDESRYIDTAVALSQVNARVYSHAEWHWRLVVAHKRASTRAARVAAIAAADLVQQLALRGCRVVGPASRQPLARKRARIAHVARSDRTQCPAHAREESDAGGAVGDPALESVRGGERVEDAAGDGAPRRGGGW